MRRTGGGRAEDEDVEGAVEVEERVERVAGAEVVVAVELRVVREGREAMLRSTEIEERRNERRRDGRRGIEST